MSPTVPKKDSLDFHSDYYFDTKSPVAFTSPLALYRDPSLTFVRLKLGYNPKTPTPFINQLVIIFRETESLLPRLMISGKQMWWTLVLWLVLTRDTNFYSPALMYFRNLLGSYCFKTRRESLQSTDFRQSWILADPPKSYRLTKELNFSIVIFKVF